METSEIKFLNAGEQGLVVEFGQEIDEAVNIKVHSTANRLLAASLKAVLEIVPTYRSLLIYFDPLQISRPNLINHIRKMLDSGDAGDDENKDAGEARVIHIPVCYGGEFGPDIAFVAEHNSLSVEEVITIHTSKPYLVYMLGFTPGFPYLGGMSEKIATPRLKEPRVKIPAGSVGIAGGQTGLYPIESPGGWQLIGRTPVDAFDIGNDKPFLFSAGNYLQFEAISAQEFQEIRAKVESRSYSPKTTLLGRGKV